ncbi:MAG: serine/threonine-protein kinase [Polyangiaceae bacterium]
MGPGDVILGHYRVDRRVGGSERSVVFAADDMTFGEGAEPGPGASAALVSDDRRRVAIKLLRPSVAGNDDAVIRFRNEARIARELAEDLSVSELRTSGHGSTASRSARGERPRSAPAVVEIFDEGTFDGAPFQVLELLEGVRLDAFVSGERRLPLPVVAYVMSVACRAIQAAHERGILHRDVCPRSLFVTRTAEGPSLRVLGFGAEPLGLPAGQYASARGDRWGLGATLYALLTGVDPFDGAPASTMFTGANSPELTPVDVVVPTLPKEVAAIVARALATRVADRYPSASALGEAISQFADEKAFHEFAFFEHLPPVPTRAARRPTRPAEPRSWTVPVVAAIAILCLAAVIATLASSS